MNRWLTLCVLLLILVLPGCAPVAGRHGGGWEQLGARTADSRTDRDRIEVGRREGTFRQLRVEVRGAPLEMYDVVVTFGDGRTFSPNLRLYFDENTSSRDIDLPGDRRIIRSVDFAYRSTNRREGKATVLLYGR